MRWQKQKSEVFSCRRGRGREPRNASDLSKPEKARERSPLEPPHRNASLSRP